MQKFLAASLLLLFCSVVVHASLPDSDVVYQWGDFIAPYSSPFGFYNEFREMALIYASSWMTVACATRSFSEEYPGGLVQATRCNHPRYRRASLHYAASAAIFQMWKISVETRISPFNNTVLFYSAAQRTTMVAAAQLFHETTIKAAVKAQFPGTSDAALKLGDELGKNVADYVWSIRSHDGYNAASSYVPSCIDPPCPAGKWWPYNAPVNRPPHPQWVDLVLFCDDPQIFDGKNNHENILVPPPPEPYGVAANNSFQVTYLYGNVTSPIRLADQAFRARFWQETGGFQYFTPIMRVANQIYPKLTLLQSLRAYFFVAAGVFESNVYQHKYKLKYEQWRPWQRFNNYAGAKIESVLPPGSWKAYSNVQGTLTPNHPDYPAGHPMSVGAWVHGFELVFPDLIGMDFSQVATPIFYQNLTSFVDPTTVFNIKYNSFAEMLYEIVWARIWLGYHTPHAGHTGNLAGRASSDWCFKALQKYAGPNPKYE